MESEGDCDGGTFTNIYKILAHVGEVPFAHLSDSRMSPEKMEYDR